MQVINIFEAKTQLSKLVQVVESGGEVIIGRYGKPVVRLVPYVVEKSNYRFGLLSGAIVTESNFDENIDITQDFKKRVIGS